MKLSIIATVLISSLIPSTLAVCADGEVGIGRKQIYQLFAEERPSQLITDNWIIIANNCYDIASADNGFQDSPCEGGPSYGSGNGVSDCDKSGMPGFVWTKGGNYHNCYRVRDMCATGPLLFESVDWCCQRW